MKKNNPGKNSIVIFLCITILSLVIGFVFLSSKLSQLKKDSSSYRVIFSKIEKVSSINGGDKDAYGEGKIILNGHEIELDLELHDIHDEITFLATLQNKGGIPSRIIDIIESSNFSDVPIKISIDKPKNMIDSFEEEKIKIKVSYSSSKLVEKRVKYKLGLITESA